MLDFKVTVPFSCQCEFLLSSRSSLRKDKLSLAKFPSVGFYVYLSTIRLGQVDKPPFSWINSNEAKPWFTVNRKQKMCFLCDSLIFLKDSFHCLCSTRPPDDLFITLILLIFTYIFSLIFLTELFKSIMKVSFFINNWSTVRLTDGQLFFLQYYIWCAFGKFFRF